MALPKAVEEQQTMAEQLHKQFYGQAEDDARNTDATDDQTPGEGEGEPEQPAPEESTWEQRYKVLQGKYNAEVHRVAQQNQALQQQLEDARNDLQSNESKLREMEQAKPVNVSDYFSQEEIDEYGEDALKMMLRAGKTAVKPELEQLRSQTQEERQRAQEQAQQQAQQHFYAALEQAVPDWAQINDDPAFHSWLQQPITVQTPQGQQQVPRQQLLEQYEAAGNSQDVITLFQGFEKAKKDERGPTEAPPSAGGGQPRDTSGKAPWTRADISKFYADYRRNMRVDPEGTRARERELEQAVQQGKVA